jgi:ribbon-helix-helix protein, copG family
MSEIYQYPLKIDAEIMQAIKETAKENGRSVNKEIEFVLRQYLLTQGKLK